MIACARPPAARPRSLWRSSGALNLLIAGIAAFAIPTPINPSGGYARLYQCGLVLFNILYMGGMASWGPRR
ncbi:hypothetical protein [Acidiferrobacter sp.]|uniref:hypothetical protein n=1 Tax=Acidiferrobacter sp. TaxID=1872107 RepID=UPI00261B5CD4|nr:hypothetical protein [Acidiferrobacter sp.]